MGYTLTTPMRSKQARDQMQTFMAGHFREAILLFPEYIDEGYDNTQGGVRTASQLHCGNRMELGFHYASWAGIDRYYIWCLCGWMSLKAGRKNRKGQPYIRYDNFEAIETIHTDSKQELAYRPNDLGVRPLLLHEGGRAPEENFRLFDIVLTEFQRLDALWNM